MPKHISETAAKPYDVKLLLKLAAIEMNNMELKLNKSEFEIKNIDLSLWLWIENNSPSFSACLPVVADCWLITFQLIVFFCCFIWFVETPCLLSFDFHTHLRYMKHQYTVYTHEISMLGMLRPLWCGWDVDDDDDDNVTLDDLSANLIYCLILLLLPWISFQFIT